MRTIMGCIRNLACWIIAMLSGMLLYICIHTSGVREYHTMWCLNLSNWTRVLHSFKIDWIAPPFDGTVAFPHELRKLLGLFVRFFQARNMCHLWYRLSKTMQQLNCLQLVRYWYWYQSFKSMLFKQVIPNKLQIMFD